MSWHPDRISFGLVKDIVGFTISLAAFGISLYSLYATTRKVDELGVIVASDVPLIDVHKEGEFTLVHPSSTATFVNSGTRYAAVVGARFVVEQPEYLDWRPCVHSASASFDFDFEPFVIKPNEIVAKNLHLAVKASTTIPAQNTQIPSALLCLEFDVSTPDGLTLSIARPYLSGRWLEKNGTREFIQENWLPGKTIALIGK